MYNYKKNQFRVAFKISKNCDRITKKKMIVLMFKVIMLKNIMVFTVITIFFHFHSQNFAIFPYNNIWKMG